MAVPEATPTENTLPGGADGDVGSLTARARRSLEDQYSSRRSWARGLKRAARPFLQSATGRLVDATRDLADALDVVDAGQRAERARNDDERRAAVEDLHGAVAAVGARTTALEGRIADFQGQVADLRAEVSTLRDERDSLVARFQSLQRRVAASGEPRRAEAPATGAPSPARDDVLDSADYLEFERRFRGSRDDILERQRGTLALVRDTLGQITSPLLDLGCGRGEWLEVLHDAGVPAYGVDNNPDMAHAAHERGLDVRVDDGPTHLAQVEQGSLGAVSAFHLAEHLPLGVLGRLLDDAYDAISDDGVLLLETPDPTNLGVGAANFYVDPTHLRPLHPQLLRFLVEVHGFVDVEVHKMHVAAPEMLVSGGSPGLNPDYQNVIESLSRLVYGAQDYLVVARRPARVAMTNESSSDDATSNSASV